MHHVYVFMDSTFKLCESILVLPYKGSSNNYIMHEREWGVSAGVTSIVLTYCLDGKKRDNGGGGVRKSQFWRHIIIG